MTYRIVVPAIDPEMTSGFLASLDPGLRHRVTLIDNCKRAIKGISPDVTVIRARHNLGVAGSWNAGLAAVRAAGASYAVFCTASVRFGAAGGRDLAAVVAEAGPWGCAPAPTFLHTVVLSVAFFDLVGEVDGNYHPGYVEELDLFRRGALCGVHIPDRGVLDASTVRDGHGVDRLRSDHGGKPTINYEALDDYWRAKWGFDYHDHNPYDVTVGHQHPFGDESKPISWWPPVPSIPALRARYGIVGR